MGVFKTKARAIELLGRKQIRDSITGLSEIMKNSYDADAEILRVEFNTIKKSPYIIVYDTGYGMDQYDFENKWLVLGTESKKVTKKEKTSAGRTLMGEKGIGRLAVAKLGQQTIIVSKTTDSKWNMLYLNWNVFENPLLMINDVVIPSRYNFDYKDIENVIHDLIEEQKKNLCNEIWKNQLYGSLWQSIDSQINNIYIDIDALKDVCEFIQDERDQGTAILMLNLNENWDRYLDARERDNNGNKITDKSYDRLASFISDFQHVDEEFTVEVFYNGKILEFNYDYDESDYDKCDLRIEGYIKNGKFFGSLHARNANEKLLNECNQELKNGLDVTAGLKEWNKYDCGKFDVKLCHVELDRKKSGLTTDEYEQIKKKMAISGGISVYRDNVRILPYGEVENDFLGLERRRTTHAGTYLFSHRNMFGRIDITSENNPMLEDKSSREGLIENEQFFYFLTIMQNLLIRIAKEYVSDSVKDSKALRRSYVDFNEQLALKKENQEKVEKEEKRLQKEYMKSLLTKYVTNKKQAMNSEKVINEEINALSKKYDLDGNMSFSNLNILKNSLKNNVIQIKQKINTLRGLIIVIDERYLASIDVEDIDNIDEFNYELRKYLDLATKNLELTAQIKEDEISKFIDNWWNNVSEGFSGSPIEFVNELVSDVDNVIERFNYFAGDLKEYCKQRERKVHSKLTFIDKINRDIDDIIGESIKEKFLSRSEHMLAQLNDMKSSCNNLLNMSPYDIQTERSLINKTVLLCQHKIEEYYFDTIRYIEKNFDELDSKAEFLKLYASSDNAHEMNSLIGVLKRKNIDLENQIEIYSELANLGLSAEIVNHEFNQLFTNVYDAIMQMKYESINSNARYLLNQIEIGFRAISDRQSQLSPMYRSRNLNKRPVSVKNMINDIYNFFKEKLENNNIEFINNVPEDIVITLSLSKIYPVLSNLIYNSIFWVTDRNDRKILFHFDTEDNSLLIEDTGPGIPTKYMKKVFEPFFSLRPNGRGLGLTIAKKVLETQGYTIDIISTGEKKLLNGACFRICFN